MNLVFDTSFWSACSLCFCHGDNCQKLAGLNDSLKEAEVLFSILFQGGIHFTAYCFSSSEIITVARLSPFSLVYGLTQLNNTQYFLTHSSVEKPALTSLPLLLLQDSFPARFGGIHFVNQPWYIHALYTVIRPFLKEKTRKRVLLLFCFKILSLSPSIFSELCCTLRLFNVSINRISLILSF